MNSDLNLNSEVSIKPHTIIIAYHALPNTNLWGAAQRMHYLSEHLVENNHSVVVISADFGVSNYSGKTLNYQSIGIKIKPKFIQKYQESSQNTYEDQITPLDENHNFKLFNKLKDLFKKSLKNFFKYIYTFLEKLFFNDFANYGFLCYLWEIKARRITLEQIKLNNTKSVIISGPYFGAFKIAKAIKKSNNNIKLILDYRDPWNLLNKSSNIPLLKEKKYLYLADKIVMFSDTFKKDMIKKFSLPEPKCLTVYNGFDSDLWQEVEDELRIKKKNKIKKKFVISYISSNVSFKDGTPRDPRNLIRAVSKLENFKNITLNIIGCIDELNEKEFLDCKFDLNLLPFIPHKEALKVMHQSNILVILSTEKTTSKYTLTGKLFDCIRSGKFVLGIANSNNVNYRLLIEDLNIGKGCANEVCVILNILKNQYEIWSKSNCVNNFVIDKKTYSRRNQNMNLIKTLN